MIYSITETILATGGVPEYQGKFKVDGVMDHDIGGHASSNFSRAGIWRFGLWLLHMDGRVHENIVIGDKGQAAVERAVRIADVHINVGRLIRERHQLHPKPETCQVRVGIQENLLNPQGLVGLNEVYRAQGQAGNDTAKGQSAREIFRTES